MTDQEKILKLFEIFSQKYGISWALTDTLKKLSYDENNNVYVYDKENDYYAISPDSIAQNVYRIARYKGSNKKKDSIASIDSLIINPEKDWIFIEFKNSKVGSTKDSVNAKGYQSWHMIMDIFDEIKTDGIKICPEFYDNQLKYAKEHVTYILVFNSDKDPFSTEQVLACEIAKMHYQPDFMLKMEKYLYKSAFVITERELSKFIKNDFINL